MQWHWPFMRDFRNRLTRQKIRLLVIFGESWHDEHKFFSARDVELAIEGIHEGKYTKAVLEWGTKAIDLFPGVQKYAEGIGVRENIEKGVEYLKAAGNCGPAIEALKHYRKSLFGVWRRK